MTTLVTGAAGFIGHFVCLQLLQQGEQVVGLDNLCNPSEQRLKADRLARLKHPSLTFVQQDITDGPKLQQLFAEGDFDHVIHLAAEAGVQQGADNPQAFVNSNVVGFNHLLECCRQHPPQQLIYASTAAVYGDTDTLPTPEIADSSRPLTLYAATKKTNEVMAHSYAHLYGLTVTGLRFFTVYGPWGRPDMALSLFAERITTGQAIELHNHGKHTRDMIYIDDLVRALLAVWRQPPKHQPDSTPHQLFNLGHEHPNTLQDMVDALQRLLGQSTELRGVDRQPGVVLDNHADASLFGQHYGFKPDTPFAVGLAHFVDWYRDYHRLN